MAVPKDYLDPVKKPKQFYQLIHFVYSGASKAPDRTNGNHLSGQMEITILDIHKAKSPAPDDEFHRPRAEVCYLNYSLNAGSSPYTSLMERYSSGFTGMMLIL